MDLGSSRSCAVVAELLLLLCVRACVCVRVRARVCRVRACFFSQIDVGLTKLSDRQLFANALARAKRNGLYGTASVEE